MSKARLQMMAAMMGGSGGGEVDPLTVPLTIKSLGSGKVSGYCISPVTGQISKVYVSKNGGEWVEWSRPSSSDTVWGTLDVAEGDTVAVKGTGKWSGNNRFELTDSNGNKTGSPLFDVYGNVMSLSFGDSFSTATDLSSLGTKSFNNLFLNQALLRSAEGLLLPAATLTNNCYDSMFSGCTGLIDSPALPAATLANYCYQKIFLGCSSLTSATAMSATTLATGCCKNMYQNCTSLTDAGALPVTTLANNCYQQMFAGCTSLAEAPVLPANTLVSGCYSSMFDGCSSLNHIKAMMTDTPDYGTTGTWVRGVASSGTFVKNASATWSVTGQNGIPSNWTIETSNE